MAGSELIPASEVEVVGAVSSASSAILPPASHFQFRGVRPMSLSELLDNSVTYESLPVTVDHRLRLCAWGGLAAMALFLFGFRLFSRMPGWQVGVFLDIVALGIGVGVAIQTQGFSRAARAGHVGIFFTVIAGALAAVPIVIAIAISILIVVAVAVAMIAGLAFCLVVLLGGVGALLDD